MTRTARHAIPGLLLTDHVFELPLDHEAPGGTAIQVYAREVVAVEHEHEDLPWLLFLQGGPGFGAPRPVARDGWLGQAVGRFRVLLLDQRGSGRSQRVDADSLGAVGEPAAQARYLGNFRADSIVRDAEAIRRELCGERPWTLLGQSYGGFCALSYLSLHPEGLAAVLVTGGIPPIGVPIDEVYRATYRRVLQKNQAYYARYPGDHALVERVMQHLETHDVRLADGARLRPRRLRQLGLELGFSDGFETLHYLFEDAFDPGRSTLSFNFLKGVERLQSFETNPIFAILHESIYCEQVASNWSAQRVLAEFPQFSAGQGGAARFTGEMIYPWMFEDYPRLAPMAAAAQLLAIRSDWPRLYREDRLARNRVPVMAAVYSEDMYVERGFSEAVAARVSGMRIWLTNEYQHNGLRADGALVLGRLLGMLDGTL
jgi:pimeloyl-ACP methyl ester carboxylesterase